MVYFAVSKGKVLEKPNWQEVKEGNERAFENIFRTYYAMLCNYANNFFQQSEDAEEVVQATFIRMWEKREQIEVQTSLKSYLFRAVHNAALNRLKQQNRFESMDVLDASSTPHAYEQVGVETKELSALIQQQIETLPPQCRAIFTLSRFENMKYAEIADALNLSIKTVENQMGKALKMLRVGLKPYLNLIFLTILAKEVLQYV